MGLASFLGFVHVLSAYFGYSAHIDSRAEFDRYCIDIYIFVDSSYRFIVTMIDSGGGITKIIGSAGFSVAKFEIKTLMIRQRKSPL